jgi:hypothetical protein
VTNFPVEPGDPVRYVTKAGHLAVGYFVRFNRKGRAMVRAVGARGEKAVDVMFPVNDRQMVAKRGRLTVSGYNDGSTTTKAKRGSRNG